MAVQWNQACFCELLKLFCILYWTCVYNVCHLEYTEYFLDVKKLIHTKMKTPVSDSIYLLE